MLYCAGGGYGGTLTAGTGACGRNLVTETQPGGSPTVLRMILARQLQALREKAGMSYEQAGEAIYSSEWTIRRMERAEGGLKPLTVKSLLMAYGVTDPGEIGAFLALARDATKPGWWHSYDDVLPSWFRIAVGLEESAALIRAYQPQVVPGLLQTEGYIRAITAASFPAASGEFTERAVALRLARQHLLTRPEPPQYWVVLDETVPAQSQCGGLSADFAGERACLAGSPSWAVSSARSTWLRRHSRRRFLTTGITGLFRQWGARLPGAA